MSEFKPSDFVGVTLGKKLGAGTYGTVYVGLLRDGRFVAVKQLSAEGADTGSPECSLAKGDDKDSIEIQVHRRLNHPHIIRYLHSQLDAERSPPVLNVYLEFVTGGSLTSIMKTLPGGCLPPPVARVYGRHIFLGLSYLHSNGVAHRDIKGENVLVSQDTGMAKLADFDQAKVVGGSLTMKAKGGGAGEGAAKTLAGTPFWIAPEVITQEEGYDPFKADIWSATCTVAEMFTGKAPWLPMSSPMAVMYKLANSTGWPDAVPTDKAVLGDELHSFLTLGFQRDPKQRPCADEMLKHPYLCV